MERDDRDRDRIPPPRRLRTAYAYFVQDTYHQVARELRTRQPQRIISRLGEMWRTLPAEDREPYVQRENRDRARYEQAKLEWTRQNAGRPMGHMNRRRKEPNAPRRPATAYIMFKREMAERLREEQPDATARNREREIIFRWRGLDNESRERYKEKANADKVRYANEMHEMRLRERERERERREEQQELHLEGQEPAAPLPAPGPEPGDAAPVPAEEGAAPAAVVAAPAPADPAPPPAVVIEAAPQADPDPPAADPAPPAAAQQ